GQVKRGEGGGRDGVKRETALVVGIDQLMLGRGRFGENPDPAERIFAVIGAQRGRRKARPENPMKSVPAADEIACELDIPPLVPKTNFWCAAGDVVDTHVVRLEQNCAAVGKSTRDQIF